MHIKQNILLHKAAIIYLCASTVIFIIFTIFYLTTHNNVLAYTNLIFAVINPSWLTLVLKGDNSKIIKTSTLVYCIIILIGIFFNALLLYDISQMSAILWFFIVPIGARLFHSYRLAMMITVVSYILIILIFCFSVFIPKSTKIVLSDKHLQVVDIMTVSFCFMLLFYFYYTIHKTYDYTKTDIDEITEETTKITESNDICRDDKYECQMIETETFSPEELNKYNELFIKIKKYFIEKKPYIDAGFTMLKLASYLNSNTLYVSRAIKLNSGTNFNLFVNTYRIDFVKNMLDKGSATRYTMQYIYKSAGFKQQSTFNTVFKRIVGLTPTAYLEKNELTSNIK